MIRLKDYVMLSDHELKLAKTLIEVAKIDLKENITIDNKMYIIHSDKAYNIIGYIIPKLSEYKNRLFWTVSPIYMTPSARKKGFAWRTLEEFFKDKDGVAPIREDNIASQKTLIKAGFIRDVDGNNFVKFSRKEAWYGNI